MSYLSIFFFKFIFQKKSLPSISVNVYKYTNWTLIDKILKLIKKLTVHNVVIRRWSAWASQTRRMSMRSRSSSARSTLSRFHHFLIFTSSILEPNFNLQQKKSNIKRPFWYLAVDENWPAHFEGRSVVRLNSPLFLNPDEIFRMGIIMYYNMFRVIHSLWMYFSEWGAYEMVFFMLVFLWNAISPYTNII